MQKETGSGQETLLGRFSKALRSNRKLEIALYGAICLAVLTLYLTGAARERADGGEARVTVQSSGAAERDVEARLKSVLSCIRGAGRVEVMITYETGSELVTAMTTSVNSNTQETADGDKSSLHVQTTETSEPATVAGEDGNAPIVLVEREPVVRGVIVVAEGAADVSVMLDLQRAVKAVLDIPLASIEVFEYAKNPSGE